jgi:hypothetical protein
MRKLTHTQICEASLEIARARNFGGGYGLSPGRAARLLLQAAAGCARRDRQSPLRCRAMTQPWPLMSQMAVVKTAGATKAHQRKAF